MSDSSAGRLGKHSTSNACLYIKRLQDVDLATLRKLVRLSVEHMISADKLSKK